MSDLHARPTLLSTASEQARMVQLFQHVRDAVIMLDPVGVVGFWSSSAARLLDVDAPSALGRCYLELLTVRGRQVQAPLIHRALDGEECTAEWSYPRRDGSTVWVEGHFRPVDDGLGRRIGCSVILHDVTKWRAAEAARRGSEERLRNIADSIPGAVYQLRISNDGRRSVPYVSRGVEELLERTAEDMNTAFRDGRVLVLPAYREQFWQMFDRSRDDMAMWDLEFEIETFRTRRRKWIRARAFPVREPDGGTLWTGVMYDVSDRKEAEEALRESETRYRLLTENATDLICRLDPTGNCVYVSPVCRILFGMDADSMIGRRFEESVHPDDRSAVREALARAAAGPSVRTVQHRSLMRNSAPVWCESTARGVTDESGTVTEIVWVTRNIEERKRLESRVQNAMKMEAVGRLAGGVAHDFNNLLTVINGFSEVVLKNIGTQDVARSSAQIREIRKAGERASGLTRQLLAFGRRQIQSRTRVNLNTVVTDVEKMLGRIIGEDVEIELDLMSDIGMIHADIGQLEQVLMNLCVNARDAMPEGGVLTIRTSMVTWTTAPEEDLRAGDYIVLSVRDTGCGMDEATRSRIFEPFFTTKEVGAGTGLGLATVYGIVKQSEGHIAVESDVGRGSEFHVYLPKVEAKPESGVFQRNDAPARGNETILLVEDDDGVRAVTAAMLRSLGYRVLESFSGLDAIRQAREYAGPIHLLLTDVVMPNMNGRETADRIRATLPRVRVLFMSGYTDDSIIRHGVLEEEVPFLHKPLSHETLASKVRAVLAPERSASTVAEDVAESPTTAAYAV